MNTKIDVDAILSFFDGLSRLSPVLVFLMIVVAFFHSSLIAKNVSTQGIVLTWRAIAMCSVHVLFAGGVYWHLVTGGWLRENYSWNDPNIVNLVFGLFEAIVLGSLIALGIKKTAFFCQLAKDLFIIQVTMGLASATWFLLVVESLKRNNRLF